MTFPNRIVTASDSSKAAEIIAKEDRRAPKWLKPFSTSYLEQVGDFRPYSTPRISHCREVSASISLYDPGRPGINSSSKTWHLSCPVTDSPGAPELPPRLRVITNTAYYDRSTSRPHWVNRPCPLSATCIADASSPQSGAPSPAGSGTPVRANDLDGSTRTLPNAFCALLLITLPVSCRCRRRRWRRSSSGCPRWPSSALAFIDADGLAQGGAKGGKLSTR